MRGTAINVVAIVAGAGLGVLAGGRLPERVRQTVLACLGLFVCLLGIASALTVFDGPLPEALGRSAVLVVLGSLLVGAVMGELADLEGRLAAVGERLKTAVLREPPALHPARQPASRPALGPDGGGQEPQPPDRGARFVEGFVVASLVFCVGPLAILGAIQDGLSGDYQLLAVKSVLDGFAALAFASALGVGVAFSALAVGVLQGSISLLAGLLDGVLTAPAVAALDAVGGLMVLAIGLRLLGVAEVRVANLVPGLVIAPVAVGLLT